MAFLNGYALLQRMVTKDSSRADQPDGESVHPLRGRPPELHPRNNDITADTADRPAWSE
eukprot:COSAG03_NODE_5468_length_1244_cov_0.959825_1_plen_58_part_10